MAKIARQQVLEEQTLPRYASRRYYPVKIGDFFNNRYLILAKLGYGAYSTVWLAKDGVSQKHVAVKVCVEDDGPQSPVQNEIAMMRHVQECASKVGLDHPGAALLRSPTEVFQIGTQTGTHHCIVSQAQGCSLRKVQEYVPPGPQMKNIIKPIIHRLIIALNFLHAACNVVHTDLSPQNVLMRAEHEDIFQDFEAEGAAQGSALVDADGGNVCRSVEPLIGTSEHPILTDLGQMRHDDPGNTDIIMSGIYRAPEVLLGLPWSHPVDIWSLGVMTLELMEGKNLFDPIDRNSNQYVLPLATAQYISYLGSPPAALLERSERMGKYFNAEGNWILTAPIPETSLEDFVVSMPPGREKTMFLCFIRKMLTWDPEARATSNELVMDEWLMTTFDEPT